MCKTKTKNTMRKLIFLSFLIIGIITISCVENRRKDMKEDSDKNSGVTFEYERFALTKFNPNDFSWKFLEEYEESGEIIINALDKSVILNNPKKGKEKFKITKIQKQENGFIASTDKDNIFIIAIDYNRIAIGSVGSDIFGMFIFKDEDREKINNEFMKML
jgi:hypothetical protein